MKKKIRNFICLTVLIVFFISVLTFNEILANTCYQQNISKIKSTSALVHAEGFENGLPSSWDYANYNLWSVVTTTTGEVHDDSYSLKLAGSGGLEFEGAQIPISFSNGSIEAWVYPEDSNTNEPTLYLRTSTNDGDGSIGYMTIKSGYGIRIYRDYATLIRVTDYERYSLGDINFSYISNQWWHIKLEIEGTVLKAWVNQSPTFPPIPDLSFDISSDAEKYNSGKPALAGRADMGSSYSTYFDSVIVNYTSGSTYHQQSFSDDFNNLDNWDNSTNAPYPLGGLISTSNGHIDASSYGTYTQELVNNGDFETNPVGILNPKDTLTDWKFIGDNGGTYSIESGKCLNMTNADGSNDYGDYGQNVTSGYDETVDYIASGIMRLIIDGTSNTQLMAVIYRFEDSSNAILGQISFYICETVTGYVNDSQYMWLDYSPFSGDSPSWVSNPDTGWINFYQNLTPCLELLPNLDTPGERTAIDHILLVVEEYTNSIEQTQALYDNVSLSTTLKSTQELVVNGGFETDPEGILNPKDTLTDWKLIGDNGGTYSIEPGKCLNMTNADSSNDYGGYGQNVTFGFDESVKYVALGSMRLILDGTSNTQLMAVLYRFEDSSNTILGQISFYICETVTSYVNDSQYMWLDYSPFSGDSPSWASNPDTGWINFNQSLTDCLDLLPNLDTPGERAAIDHVLLVVEEYTNYIEETQALFDNVSLQISPRTIQDWHGPAIYRNVSMDDFRLEIAPKCQASPFERGLFSIAFYSGNSGSGTLLCHFEWCDPFLNGGNSEGKMHLFGSNEYLLWEKGPSATIGMWNDLGDNMTIIRFGSTLQLYINGTLEYTNVTQPTITVGSIVIQFCQWLDSPLCDDLRLDSFEADFNCGPASIPQIDSPPDIVYSEVTTIHNITWTAFDDNPSKYEIIRYDIHPDGSSTLFGVVASGSWFSLVPIVYTINNLAAGEYNYTIQINDTEGYYALDDVLVTVIAANPQIDSPPDVVYFEGTKNHNITWTAVDNNPTTYEIKRYDIHPDGSSTLFGVVASGSWKSGEPIIISIDNLVVGEYNFTIQVNDADGCYARDHVLVTVIGKTTQTSTSNTSTSTSYGSVLLIVIMLSLIFLFQKERIRK